MQDIAQRAGVTQATVSMALRDHPRIAKATRERIQRLAADMAYRPNPMVSALMAQLHTGRRVDEAPVLAYLNASEIFPHASGYITLRRYFNGALQRAEALGFKLEEFWLREPDMTARRMERILRSRGVTGVLIAPTEPDTPPISLDWSGLAVASLDRTQACPNVHWASSNHYQGMWLVLDKLSERGYQRIGLAMSRDASARVSHAFLSAWYGWHALHAGILLHPYLPDRWQPWDKKAFAKWLHTEKPDAMVVSESIMHKHLSAAGVRIPRDIGLAHLACDCAEIPCAGLEQSSEQVGAAALDLVISQLHRNERGLPVTPKTITVEGSWHDGPTVRKRKPARRKR